jgi:hypothetical protein
VIGDLGTKEIRVIYALRTTVLRDGAGGRVSDRTYTGRRARRYPFDGADVFQQGEIDSIGERVALTQDPGDFARFSRRSRPVRQAIHAQIPSPRVQAEVPQHGSLAYEITRISLVPFFDRFPQQQPFELLEELVCFSAAQLRLDARLPGPAARPRCGRSGTLR